MFLMEILSNEGEVTGYKPNNQYTLKKFKS